MFDTALGMTLFNQWRLRELISHQGNDPYMEVVRELAADRQQAIFAFARIGLLVIVPAGASFSRIKGAKISITPVGYAVYQTIEQLIKAKYYMSRHLNNEDFFPWTHA